MDYTELFSHTSVSEAPATTGDAPAHMPVFSDSDSTKARHDSSDRR